ncbi:related to Nuclear cohesin complex subunit [Melanopsichium pennsylvanicum]|uniref:Related to Nuclear cohesin complex subunit n=2 Tax=Melanopsichium pennsylvanicum TaxID=63383 RepID=A0AAJ5C6A4_9BASI|nr:related to Nuclear cohesin complex subunit [Melanopsichium pennsylvanicum 4]SNX85606.1 related to Nuclear cohesin complex subunit [Melanopsichium pennsylvanicum]
MARTTSRNDTLSRKSSSAAVPAQSVDASNDIDDSDDSLTELSSEGEESVDEDQEESSDEEMDDNDDDDNDGDFGSTRKKRPAPRRSAAGTSKAKSTNTTPRPRKTAGAAGNGTQKTARSTAKRPGPSRLRAGTTNATPSAPRSRAAASKDELPINEDNDIFNAVKDPNSALQSNAEDWVVAFSDHQGLALAKLVNFVIRTCGCNGSVDENQVIDIDNVVDNLEELQEVFKKQPIPSYPIVSRSKTFKSFRKSLNEFLHRLVMSAYDAEVLTADGFIEPYQAWVSAMSSSSLRSFRHTATVIALWTISAFNEVNAHATKDLATATKQRDAEKKKARADKSRLKDLESKVVESRKLKSRLEEYINEFINSVFVHRFRDFDASIRTECVEALGSWMKKYPTQYLQSSYFRYIGWVLSDVDANVRMAAVQAMTGLYARDSFVSSIRHFTEMFKGRLVQMATGDVELGVRIATINVLVMIDKHDLLDDEQRDLLATHIFDVEPRIRDAVASFLSNILDEMVSEGASELGSSTASKKKGKQAEEQQQEQAKLRFKCLAELLVKYGHRLDAGDSAAATMQRDAADELTVVIDGAKEGRVGMAVEALWDAVQDMQHWRPLIELLLLDHSDKAAAGRSKGSAATENAAPAAYRLVSEEEAILIEALVAILRKTYAGAELIDDENDNTKEDVSRAMIAALPKLLAKYRTDAPRIADLLLLPQVMDLEMYTELQETAAFEALWDDVSTQIQRHIEPLVLKHGVQTLQKLVATTSQSTINSTKLSALEEGLVSSLRETVNDRDVETAGFSEDEVHLLAANMLRLHLVSQACNTSDALEDDEGGQATSGWEIMLGIAGRGRLVYQEEESLVRDAIATLALHIMWKTRQVIMPEAGSQTAVAEALAGKRTTLLTLLEEFVASTQSQACIGVQRVAFEKLATIHMLYAAIPQQTPVAPTADNSSTAAAEDDTTHLRTGSQLPAILSLHCDADIQQNCAQFVQAEIERYIEESGVQKKEANGAGHATQEGSDREDADDDENNGDEEEEDAEATPKASRVRTSKKKATKKCAKARNGTASDEPERPNQEQLQAEHVFCSVISTFVSAIRVGIIDAKHSTIVLIHFNRLGLIYDSCCKALIEVLKEEAIFGGYNRAVIVESCVWDSLREAFELYLDSADPAQSEARFVSLSRQLANALVVRGAGFTALRKIDPRCLISLHSRASEHIAQKVAAAERNGNKKVKQRMPALYKGMANLLTTAIPTDAVKIKSAMDRAFRAANVQVPTTAKAWDGYRSYEKRLLKIAAKSALFAPAMTGSGSARKNNDKDGRGEIEDSGGELSEDDDDGLPARGERVLPIPARSGQKRDRPQEEVEEGGEQEEDVSIAAPASDLLSELDVGMPASEAGSLNLDLEDAEEGDRNASKRRKVAE